LDLLTIDFETYFDNVCSLRKLTVSEYLAHNDFKVHMMGVKINYDEAFVLPGEEASDFLDNIDFNKTKVLCHNTAFDGAILAQIYGKIPARYLDTMAMSSAIYVGSKSHSLKVMCERIWPHDLTKRKGDELANSFGVRDLDDELFSDIKFYCLNDVELTRAAYDEMDGHFPDSEADIVDRTVRMFTQPMLKLDIEKADSLLKKTMQDTEFVIEKSGFSRKQLASNLQFSKIINDLGIECPTKTSPTTGNQIPAVSKNDLGFQDLQTDYPEHTELWEARLAVKSRIEETRIARFLSHAKANDGYMPVPLRYYGAHTGRFSGSNKINFQNLPRNSELRKCLIAPNGHKVIAVDSSNIEARVLALIANHSTLLDLFKHGEDVYSHTASAIYGFPVNKVEHPEERFVGKVATLGLGYGMSWRKFKHILSTGSMGPKLFLSDEQCERIVNTYRQNNSPIVRLWKRCNTAITEMTRPSGQMTIADLLLVSENAIILPNNLMLRYKNLRIEQDEGSISSGYIYDEGTSLYGGKLVENIVQALARIVITDQMMEAQRQLDEVGGRVVLTVHDEIVAVVKDEYADEMLQHVINIMETPPAWAKSLPLAAEGDVANNYVK